MMNSTHVKCSVFIATSLDGFIARPDGSLDWLDRANSLVPPGEDCGYQAFMSTIDALIMGRNTFEKVLSFGGEWPYGSMPIVVLSRHPLSIPEFISTTVTASSETPTELVTRLGTQGMKHLYIDGGQTIQRFLAEQLIDELTITVLPVLIGTGKPLFGPLPADVRLIHRSTQTYEFGFVQHHYQVCR